MKKILLISTLLLTGVFYNAGKAQCTFGNVGVIINSSHTDPATQKCVVNFDLYFDVDHNPGGKYFWIHIWPTGSYPNYSYPQSQPPTTSQISGGNGALDNSLTTFGYFHQGGSLQPQLSYPPDPNAPGFQSGYSLTEIQGAAGFPDRYIAHGLNITLPQACTIAQSLTADLWESQSDHAQTVACVSKDQPFYVNDPTIVGGLLFCQLPRTYKFDITTLSVASRTVNYEVHIDYNGDGIYNPLADTPIVKSGTVTISNSSPFESGIQSYLPYSNLKPYSDRELWVVVLKNGVDLPNDVYARISNTCIPLPVLFSSFTARREQSIVRLNWTTSTEIDNNGFEVQRNTGSGNFETLAFIPSQTIGGNSGSVLNYSYSDLNISKSITQYRIRQIDLNGQSKYSNIIAVRGIDQKTGVIIYPNPTSNGQVNVLFADATSNNEVSLIDMNGRILRRWHQINNNITISDLIPGMYCLQIVNTVTKESSIEKFSVINY